MEDSVTLSIRDIILLGGTIVTIVVSHFRAISKMEQSVEKNQRVMLELLSSFKLEVLGRYVLKDDLKDPLKEIKDNIKDINHRLARIERGGWRIGDIHETET